MKTAPMMAPRGAFLKPETATVRGVDRERLLARMERFAWAMDKAVRIPGTGIRLGADSILGLVPVVGDAATGIAQAGLILTAHHHFGLPKTVLARMASNVALDLAVGAIPLLGDLFDVRFKANTRNVELLKRHLAARDGGA